MDSVTTSARRIKCNVGYIEQEVTSTKKSKGNIVATNRRRYQQGGAGITGLLRTGDID